MPSKRSERKKKMKPARKSAAPTAMSGIQWKMAGMMFQEMATPMVAQLKR